MVKLPLREGTCLYSKYDVYRIERCVGSGGFGITYYAIKFASPGSGDVDKIVAIKEFYPSDDCERSAGGESVTVPATARARFDGAKADFLAEARRLQQLSGQCPNIVPVSDVFEANSTAYYVMEYLQGQTLREFVTAKGRLSQAETLGIMLPIVKAVAFLHGRRIMHLDIKPSNIMLANRPVLIDFGQSKHYDETGQVTRTVAAAGLSDGYAPIEQYAGIGKFSPESDVYALAATMVFCLTGQRPERAVDLDHNQLARQLRELGVSDDLNATLVKAMALKGNERPVDAARFAALIDDDRTVIMDRGKVKTEKEKNLPRTFALSMIFVLVIALAIVITLLVRNDKTESSAPVIPDEEMLDTVVAAEEPAEEVVADTVPASAVYEGAALVEDEVPAVPEMHTYNFRGSFYDSSGEWPIRLTAVTDNSGQWGKCTYVNVNYGVTLSMTGSGSDYNYTFTTRDKGSDLRIHITYEGEGTWSGTATSGSKTLNVILYE